MTFLEPFAQAWLRWIGPASIQLFIFTAIVMAAAWLARRQSARLRYGLWLLVLLKALLPPGLEVNWGVGRWGLRPIERSILNSLPAADSPAMSITASFDPRNRATSDFVPGEQASVNRHAVPAGVWLLVCWAMGTGLFLGVVGWRCVALARRLARIEPIDEGPLRIELERIALKIGCKHTPDLVVTEGLPQPFLFGLRSPKIVLPGELLQSVAPERLRYILTHELMHWRRRDLIPGWILLTVQALFWFHPAVWLTAARLRHERECACDEAVLATEGIEPQSYGASLLSVLLASQGRAAVGAGLLGIFERHSLIQDRLEEIMRYDTAKKRLRAWHVGLLALVAVIFIPMGACRTTSTPTPAEKQSITLKHDDGLAEGKQSYGGTGQAVRFECPAEGYILTSVDLFGSRYGTPAPPAEPFKIYIMDSSMQVIQTVLKPYSEFERGSMKWVHLPTPPIAVPKTFWIGFNFNAHETKGVYVGIDNSAGGFSKIGLPGEGYEDLAGGKGWMIRAEVSPAQKGSQAELTGTPTPTATPVDARVLIGGYPQIVSVVPSIGATDVDPSIKEIAVTFSQDMNRNGYAWTGGGESFPRSPEGARPSWRDARTCVLPVALESGRYYRVGINSPPKFVAFKSAAGEPALTTDIYFCTAGATDAVKQRVRIPKIVKMEPANGATFVDPATAELRVTFDIPMGSGMSWCGGGEHYPASVAGQRAHWSDDNRTCILPVKLHPNWAYALGINSPSFKNFKSEWGVSVEPVRYEFSTGAGH